ncbi:Alpha/Beta hydrolase protein, partial [Syncephalis pseudoplumigaleata]
LAARLGFAVVIIDGRGSSQRGLAFEAPIQRRLGRIELADQLAGLRWLARERGIVDMERVAISGWSYGGYLSLMGLALYPDAFKLAIAGAPVTQWEAYDSAYTERYMGLPSEHPTEYMLSSVMHYIDYFPNEENRLLIVHGLMDENVHFTHTERLMNALIKRNKPHHVQFYPGERHGLRHAEANEHYETLFFWWLLNYL